MESVAPTGLSSGVGMKQTIVAPGLTSSSAGNGLDSIGRLYVTQTKRPVP